MQVKGYRPLRVNQRCYPYIKIRRNNFSLRSKQSSKTTKRPFYKIYQIKMLPDISAAYLFFCFVPFGTFLFLFFYELKHFFITFEWNNIKGFRIYPNKKKLYFLGLWSQTRSLPNSIYFFIDHSSISFLIY